MASRAVPRWPGQLSLQGQPFISLPSESSSGEVGSVPDAGTLAPASLPSFLSLRLNVSGAEE